MPHAVFSYPQIAGVGKTEDEIISQGLQMWVDYEVATHNYKNTAMWSAMQSEVGMVKIIVEKKSWLLLGAHIIWEKSSDIIHMLWVYMSENIPVQNMLTNYIFIHPALSEVIRNAVRKVVKKLG